MPASKRLSKPKSPPDPNKLAREQAGSYRTDDGRFMVRQDRGGKWYVTDSEQTNELGLELVLGPFDTIAEAKAAVETQREQPTGASPGVTIHGRVPSIRRRPNAAAVLKPPATGVNSKPAPASRATVKPKPEPKAKAELKAQPEPEPERPKVDHRPAPWHPTGDERDAVAGALRRINNAWIATDPKEMRDFLDPDVVFVQPGFSGRSEGRDAAIRSYDEFVASAVIHAYAESDLAIDLTGHTAVATYRFEIDYEMEGKRLLETGRDLFVFGRTGTRWRAVWRLLMPDAPAAPEALDAPEARS